MEQINGYNLIEPPYKGGMALVYKGEKGPFTRAFKMVRPDKAENNPRLCQRFLKEISVQSKLDHPNIIKLLDAYPYTNADGMTVTVIEMEWLNGMDLQRYVEKKAPAGLDAKTIIAIANMVADGLEYAHKKQILHLDVKPSNIFRTDEGYIKIIDFGIARVMGENPEIVEGASKLTVVGETGESTFKGTLAYASPEQQVGGRLSFASDIYSFGKTLHFLSTGTTDPSAEIKDPLISNIVAKCTSQNPKHRYQSFDEVRKALTDTAEETENVKCLKCGASISKTAKFCPECGSPIQKTPQQKENCPKCKKERHGADRFCDNCGWDFTKQITPEQPKKLKGYYCSRCNNTTKPYGGGTVNFCNYCGAPKTFLTPKYQ